MERSAVVSLPDKNDDGRTDGVNTFIRGIKRPHSGDNTPPDKTTS